MHKPGKPPLSGPGTERQIAPEGRPVRTSPRLAIGQFGNSMRWKIRGCRLLSLDMTGILLLLGHQGKGLQINQGSGSKGASARQSPFTGRFCFDLPRRGRSCLSLGQAGPWLARRSTLDYSEPASLSWGRTTWLATVALSTWPGSGGSVRGYKMCISPPLFDTDISPLPSIVRTKYMLEN